MSIDTPQTTQEHTLQCQETGFCPACPACMEDAWTALHGIAPDATGDLSSEQFIRKMRDAWG